MKSQFVFFASVALALTACVPRAMNELSDRERQFVIKRNMDRCLAEGVGNQDLIRCTLDKMCCYTPSKKPDYTRIFDASTGKWLTGNAAATAIKRANRQE